jgi:hypothetical protein
MAAAGVQENAGFNAALAGGNHVVAVAADEAGVLQTWRARVEWPVIIGFEHSESPSTVASGPAG